MVRAIRKATPETTRATTSDQPGFDQAALGGSAQIIDIDAGADDPAPGLEQFYIGALVDRVGVGSAGPLVFDEARTVLLGDLDHLGDEFLAGGISHFRLVHTDHFGFDAMHQHDRVHAVDEHIFVAAIAQALQGADGTGLGDVLGELTGLGALVETIDDGDGGIGDGLEFGGAQLVTR